MRNGDGHVTARRAPGYLECVALSSEGLGYLLALVPPGRTGRKGRHLPPPLRLDPVAACCRSERGEGPDNCLAHGGLSRSPDGQGGRPGGLVRSLEQRLQRSLVGERERSRSVRRGRRHQELESPKHLRELGPLLPPPHQREYWRGRLGDAPGLCQRGDGSAAYWNELKPVTTSNRSSRYGRNCRSPT